MKKKLKACLFVVLLSLIGAWSLSLWFGYTVPVILHDDTEVKTPGSSVRVRRANCNSYRDAAPMRKPRLEIEGGPYHIITRGNNRQLIFGSHHDYLKMLVLLAERQAKLPFFRYAYCLMPNHVHLLIERRDDSISQVMHAAYRLQPVP